MGQSRRIGLRQLGLGLGLLIGASASSAQTQLLYAGELLVEAGEKPRKQQTLVIENQKITAVRSGYIPSDEFEGQVSVIDLKDKFVMPGLIDSHVHLQFELGPNNDREELKDSKEVVQMRSVYFAQKTLAAGFTTVRDVGSNEQAMYALRDAIEKGWIEGPRILAAGSVGITGGHNDVSGKRPELMKLGTHDNVCDGPFDCRRATRNSIKYGADLIKITSTGGVLTDRATGTGQQMETDELKEVVLAAQRMGRKVASHAHQEDGVIAALEAGVDSIEHGTYTSSKAIKLFKKSGAYLVPTLLAGETVKQMALTMNFMSPAIKEKSIRVGGDMMKNFGRAYNAGVKIAFGTDSGVSQHGINAQEAVLMVKAGMKEEDVLISATTNAADLLGVSETVGNLNVGKYADIIAVDASPLNDIEQLLDVKFVMKSGKVFKD